MAIQFTKEEISKIQEITTSYTDMMRQIVAFQTAIEEAENELIKLTRKMEELKERETYFFYDLGAKYDMEPANLQIEAANMILQR